MNAYDQQWVQTRLWSEHGVRSVRLTLAEVADRGELRPVGGGKGAHESSSSSSEVSHLYVDGVLISVAYFRSGYTPEDHPTEAEWAARLLIERSDAVKCPDVTLHLAGAKKIQQDLARPGVVEKYLGEDQEEREGEERGGEEPKENPNALSSTSAPSPSSSPGAPPSAPPTSSSSPSAPLSSSSASSRVRALFAGLWGLSASDLAADPSARRAVEDALANPHEYVLKPQREGGGNNLYGPDVARRLRDPAGLEAYILMQRIKPPPARSVLLRKGRAQEVDALCELGIYSIKLVGGRGDDVILDKVAGHLVRTKPQDSDEGGVAAGFAVLDSPYLVD